MTNVTNIRTAPPPPSPNTFILTANDGSPGEVVPIGTPVTTTGGRGIPAYGHELALAQVVGLASSPINEGRPFRCRYAGPLVLTEEEWAEVVTNADNTHVLRPGLVYLSTDVPGQLTNDPGSTSGDFAVCVGRALDATTLMIILGTPFAL